MCESFGLGNMLITFLINLVFVWVTIHFFYYRKCHRRDYYFTFLLISIAIFFVMYYMVFMLGNLGNVASLGIGIGLFGIFSIMRYRTESMPVREMTYLFSILSLSVVNALGAGQPHFSWVIFIPNVVTLVAIALSETILFHRSETSKLVKYDRIELIVPERYDELVADLEKRTGLEITRVDVGSIDFMRDMAILKIRYKIKGHMVGHIDASTHIDREEWEEMPQS